jgi:hypothetical protein
MQISKYFINTLATNVLKTISILIILLAFASPAYAGTPVVDTQIGFTPSIYPGQSSTLNVLVSEISGSDWVKDVTVSVQISPGSGVIVSSPSQSISRINKLSSKQFSFPVEVTDVAASGNRNIVVTVKYYEMDLLNINTLGPYYMQDDQYFNIKNPYGKISVSTNPQGVDIYVDGKYMGKSPMTISNVVQGKHTVLLKKDGYNDVSTTVSVTADSQSSISKTLTQKTGSISVSTNPRGASVNIDGKYAGISPLTANGILPGSHDISFSMNNYRDVYDSFYVSAGTTTTYSKNLVKENGNIDIDSTPAGASVYFGSSYKGVTPLYLEGISPGTHTIRLVKNGYKDLHRTVTVKDDSTSSVSASMEKLTLAEKVVTKVNGGTSSSATTYSVSTTDTATSDAQLLGSAFVLLAILISIAFGGKILKSRNKSTTNIENQTVVHNIHYGDNIETHIKDSVVQRSNIGSKTNPCPYCRNAKTPGEVCAACGKIIE